MNQNKKPMVIVITGGIATGKSAVTSYIKDLGYTVLDSDKIVHEAYNSTSPLIKILVDEFGEGILDKDKNVDRHELGKVVLNNDIKLKKLNKIVHKHVTTKLLDGINKSTDKIIFLDIPLMLEEKQNLIDAGLKYDEIWLIYVSKETQKNRLTNRAIIEHKDIEQTLKILDKQMPIEIKKDMVDRVINNEGTIEKLHENVKNIISNIVI